MTRAAILVAALLAAGLPVVLAAQSDYLAYRGPVYIAAGFAGILALGALLIQPLLPAGLLAPAARARRLHAALGAVTLSLVALHVAGLWVTSPPDMIDALTFTAPTLFSVFGVLSMWALLLAAVLVALRRRLPGRVWRRGHRALVALAVAGGVAHALMIEGTMEPWSKAALCALVVAATAAALVVRRTWVARV